MRKQVMFLTAAVALASGVAMAGPGDWTYAGTFGNPPTLAAGTDSSNAANRVAVDSTGKLYVSVGTNDANPKLVWYAPAPTTSLTTPTYTLLSSITNEELANGFQGISTDAANNVYLSGDDGAGVITPSKIQKFDSAGNPVATFGTGGTVLYPSASARTSGNALFSNGNLLVTNLHGTVGLVLDPATGDALTTITWTVGLYLRDVVIKPDTVGGNDVIFALKSGIPQRITGGTAAAPAGYTTITPWSTGGTPVPFDTNFDTKPGIGYFAKDDTIIHGNYDRTVGGTENNAYVIDASTGNVLQVLAGIYRAGDCATYTSAGVDYLYILNGSTSVQVYSKPTTPAAAVNEWSLY